MANTIILKKGAGVPSPDDLQEAELALDVVDGRLFSKLQDGEVHELTDQLGEGVGVQPGTEAGQTLRWNNSDWEATGTLLVNKNSTCFMGGNLTIEVAGGSNTALKLGNRNTDAETHLKPNGAIFRTDESAGGILVRKNVSPIDETGNLADGAASLGTTNYTFLNGYFSGVLQSTGEIRAQDPATTHPVRLVQQGALGKLVNGANGDMEVGAENTGSVHLVAGDGSRKVTVDKDGRTGIGGTPGSMMVEYFEALERTGQLEEGADLVENMDARAVNPTTAILQVNGTSYFKDEMATVSGLTTAMGLNSESVMKGGKWYRTADAMVGLSLESAKIRPTDNTGTGAHDKVNLGTADTRFKAAYFANSVRIGATNSDDVQINGVTGFMFKNGMCGLRMVASGLVPVTGDGTTGDLAHNAYDIGSASRSWRDGYFGGTVYATKFVGDGSGLTNLPGGSGGGGSYIAGDGIDINNTTGEIKMDGSYPGTFTAEFFEGDGSRLTNINAEDSRISNDQIQNWDAAYNWGNHADAGYAKGNLADYVDLSTNQNVAGQKNFTQELKARRFKIGDTNTIYAASQCGLHFSTNQNGTPMVLGTTGDGAITTGDGLNLGRSTTRFNKAYLRDVDAETGVYSGSLSSNTLTTNKASTGAFFTANIGAESSTFSHTNDSLYIQPKDKKISVQGTVDAQGFTINGQPISGGGPTYTAGNGISINNDQIAMKGSYTGNFSVDGTITGTDCIATSDERLKKNVEPVKAGVITQLQGVDFEWNETDRKSSGFIAQEVEKVPGLEHLVHQIDKDGHKGVSYIGMIPYLLAEIQQLRAEVEELKK